MAVLPGRVNKKGKAKNKNVDRMARNAFVCIKDSADVGDSSSESEEGMDGMEVDGAAKEKTTSTSKPSTLGFVGLSANKLYGSPKPKKASKSATSEKKRKTDASQSGTAKKSKRDGDAMEEDLEDGEISEDEEQPAGDTPTSKRLNVKFSLELQTQMPSLKVSFDRTVTNAAGKASVQQVSLRIFAIHIEKDINGRPCLDFSAHALDRPLPKEGSKPEHNVPDRLKIHTAKINEGFDQIEDTELQAATVDKVLWEVRVRPSIKDRAQ